MPKLTLNKTPGEISEDIPNKVVANEPKEILDGILKIILGGIPDGFVG